MVCLRFQNSGSGPDGAYHDKWISIYKTGAHDLQKDKGHWIVSGPRVEFKTYIY